MSKYMDDKLVIKYFEENANQWVRDGYKEYDYNYPVGAHRERIVKKVIQKKKLNKKCNVIDLGCGGGDVCISLARDGHKVVGVDQSKKMIDIAKERADGIFGSSHEKPLYYNSNILEYDTDKKFDIILALGVIGYINNENDLFERANKLLAPGGVFIISCRNRLFNLFNGSKYFLDEIKSGNVKNLYDQVSVLDQDIPSESSINFMNKLEDIVSDFKSDSVNKSVVEELQKETNKNENFDFTFSCDDNKQHTPEQLDVVANMEGFVKDSIYGVHPHLLGSNLNKLLPPGLYNKLSEPLEAFEDLPISLTWCSVFMSVYRLSD